MMNEDLIRRSDAIGACAYETIECYEARKAIRALPSADRPQDDEFKNFDRGDLIALIEAQKERIGELLADRPQGQWIEVKWHEITDEEREKEGYPKDWITYMDCQMPADGERILIQTRWGMIELDEAQIDGEMYLDSGYSWVDDVVAWMPLPKPWEGADDESTL